MLRSANDCSGDASCKDFVACVEQCDARDCEAACRTKFPDGYDVEAARVRSCEAAKCETECGIKCGGTFFFPLAECGDCANKTCCVEATTCMKNAECSTLAACERACRLGDAACLQACELAHQPV